MSGSEWKATAGTGDPEPSVAKKHQPQHQQYPQQGQGNMYAQQVAYPPYWGMPAYPPQQMAYWGPPQMMPPPFAYAAPPPAPPYTPKPKRVASRKATLGTSLDSADLVTLHLISPPLDIDPPAYPPHLPFVRCCYDSNEKKGCEKGAKCYHLHKDPVHRYKPDQPNIPGRNHEVYVARPHFVAFDNTTELRDLSSFPCHYGVHCKDAEHREMAQRHKYSLDGMRDYETFLRNYRNYEFELIKYQLAVNKARRELTDDTVLEAFEMIGEKTAELSILAREQCEAALSLTRIKLAQMDKIRESAVVTVEDKAVAEPTEEQKKTEYKSRPWLPTSGL